MRGGDLTAAAGGQVSLNPIPHILREPFGMVVMPLLGIASGSGLIGWASAPYDPAWSQTHPKRAAWMSLAGPAANFSIAILAAIAMRIGLMLHFFTSGPVSTSQIVSAATPGVTEGNRHHSERLLFPEHPASGCFNLLPFPPLDGYGVLGLFTTRAGALKLQQWRVQFRAFAIIGLILGWRMIDSVYIPDVANGAASRLLTSAL